MGFQLGDFAGGSGIARSCKLTSDAPGACGRQETLPGQFRESGISPDGRESPGISEDPLTPRHDLGFADNGPLLTVIGHYKLLWAIIGH